MLIRALGIIVALSLAPKTAFAEPADQAPDAVKTSLSQAKEVSIFVLSLSGKYDYDSAKIKENSDIFIRRRCGANCAYTFRPIIEHLAKSKPSNCLSGQQNLLIQIGDGEEIIYSQSGRMIMLGKKCYYNKNSINGLIRQPSLIFD
jgi:hypothetical protein